MISSRVSLTFINRYFNESWGCFDKQIYFKLVVSDSFSVFNYIVQYSVDVTCI